MHEAVGLATAASATSKILHARVFIYDNYLLIIVILIVWFHLNLAQACLHGLRPSTIATLRLYDTLYAATHGCDCHLRNS